MADLLGLSDPEALLADAARHSVIYGDAAGESPTAVLARLFVFCAPVAADSFEVLPGSLKRELLEHELVEIDPDGEFATGNVTISEVGGRYYLADRLFENIFGTLSVTMNADKCMPPHASSFELARAIGQRAAGSAALDVGCGSGCLTLPLARSGGAVTGIDIGGRAIEFARANASLNGVRALFEQTGWAEFDPGVRYDRVLFNAPDAAAAFGFVSAGVPRLLAAGGVAHVWLWCEVLAGDGDVHAAVARLGRVDPPLTVRVVINERSPFSLGRAAIAQGTRPPNTLLVERTSDWARYVASLRARDVVEVASLVLEISAAGGRA